MNSLHERYAETLKKLSEALQELDSIVEEIADLKLTSEINEELRTENKILKIELRAIKKKKK